MPTQKPANLAAHHQFCQFPSVFHMQKPAIFLGHNGYTSNPLAGITETKKY
jgi:hypothetical protein